MGGRLRAFERYNLKRNPAAQTDESEHTCNGNGQWRPQAC